MYSTLLTSVYSPPPPLYSRLTPRRASIHRHSFLSSSIPSCLLSSIVACFGVSSIGSDISGFWPLIRPIFALLVSTGLDYHSYNPAAALAFLLVSLSAGDREHYSVTLCPARQGVNRATFFAYLSGLSILGPIRTFTSLSVI
ncbi:hypothetical protein BDV30DRAFT_24631 [Aspergillus minisclerotigenes]|uniref:Uncharacterized protein n=1 Tax=Aspergillus minisclerotigenes TaxID=656917 RepID=A0A5N6JFM8_9EURO|nr:hypothetical protein BDV30DRAFT_24631 [Aspergillus minisclerotigenes]